MENLLIIITGLLVFGVVGVLAYGVIKTMSTDKDDENDTRC